MKCHQGGDNERWEAWWGDLVTFNEDESGCRSGATFNAEYSIDHLGNFDSVHRWPQPEKLREYLTHTVSVCVWRWGFTLMWRGRDITGTHWDIPRSHFGADGQLLEDYR